MPRVAAGWVRYASGSPLPEVGVYLPSCCNKVLYGNKLAPPFGVRLWSGGGVTSVFEDHGLSQGCAVEGFFSTVLAVEGL